MLPEIQNPDFKVQKYRILVYLKVDSLLLDLTTALLQRVPCCAYNIALA